MEFRDLKKQYQVLKTDIDNAMQKVAAAGNYIMGGPVIELEEQLADYVGVKHCITCANGTDALTLALKSLGIGKGDAVFVPDFTFFASAEVVALEGATPVFVDVNPRTFNIDVVSLKEAIDAVENEGILKMKAIIAVDLFGLPADFIAVRKIAKQHGLYVIEDGAQGFGGRMTEGIACSLGDISTTSFFPAKPLGCYGDGGAVFTNNDKWADIIRSLRIHGKGRNKYDNVRIGMNSRIDTLQAAILQVKLNAFKEHELEAVNHVAAQYTRLINQALGNAITTPYISEGYMSSWAQYTLQLTDASQRMGIQTHMKETGIPTMIYYPTPMSMQTAFSSVHSYVDTPNAQKLSQCVLSLPMHPYLTDEDIQMIVDALVANIKTGK
jgi:dTDP-4-amino-4,6-dideoxygalactose transaminase